MRFPVLFARPLLRCLARLARISALACVAIGAGCSLLVTQSDSQCDTTASCLALGPSFANTYCAAHACVASCTTNAQCTGSNASDPWICRAGICAPLLSEDCKTLVADPDDLTAPVITGTDAKSAGEVLWLGMLLPLDPETAPLSKAKENAAELARNEFNAHSGGLPAATEGAPNRHFAFVVCDDTADADRAAKHLTDDVGVPAIIGPVYSDTLVTVATDVTDARGVLLITPSATATDITNLPGKNDLVWRTCPSDAVQATAMALAVSQTIEPALKKGVLASGGPLKLANVYKGDAYGEGLGDALAAQLRFNDADTTTNGKNGDYVSFDYGDPSDPADTNPDAEYKAAVAAVLALLPHVVTLVGTQEVITNILAPIEAQWPTSVAYRPRYLLSDGAYPRPELLQLVGTNADLRARVLGTAPGTTSLLYAQFLTKYASTFQDGTTPVLSTAATYDAAYLLAYATAAIGATPVTGASLVDGLKKIVAPGAPVVDVGPDGISGALLALAATSNPSGDAAATDDASTGDAATSEAGAAKASPGEIKVVGTSGPLDYDVATGDPDGDIQVWCLGIDASGAASGFQSSGLYYDPSLSTTMLQGTINNCP